MMKSASLRNLVLLIRAKVWDCARSWYGISLSSGRYGCRTWWLFDSLCGILVARDVADVPLTNYSLTQPEMFH